MYRAIDIAYFIVNYVNRVGGSISNLKLQKIMYYIQAAFLVERNIECFSDPILCWRHGPVIRSVYDAFTKYGSGCIESQNIITRIVAEEGKLKIIKIPFDENIISIEDRQLIRNVVNSLMPYSAWYLVDRTHEEDPWEKLPQYNDEITSESIREYFLNNSRRIYGQFDN